MTNCYFSKMAAIIYPTHMFCNMTLLLSRWCRAYFSTPSNPDGPMAALREHSDPPPGTALNHPSRFYSLKTLALGKYFSCKPSYMTRWLLWDDCGEALEDNRPVWGQGAEAPEMQAKEPSQKWILQVQPVPHGKKQWPRWVIPKLLTCTVTSKIKWLLKDTKFWGSLLCN